MPQHPARAAPLLSLRQIRKRFGATRALDGVDLTLRAGEVLALMGANGAGKSTLVQIISGACQADSGELLWRGESARFASPRAARQAGIASVYQQTSQLGVPGLSVAQNLLLDQLCSAQSALWLTPASIRRQALAIAATVAPELPLEADFADLSPAQCQLLALARAQHSGARLIIFDEPTASLSARESTALFTLIEQLKRGGVAILYVSHRLADLRRIADRAVVLRNGRVVGEFAVPLQLDAAVEAMIGGQLPARLTRVSRPASAPRLVLKQVQLLPGARPFDLRLHAGEIVAVTGHFAAGKSRLLHGLFGGAAFHSGQVNLDGVPWHAASSADAIAAGVFMAAADRWRSSFLPPEALGSSLSDLMALPHLKRWFPRGWVKQQVLDERARVWIDRLGIVCDGVRATPDQLSGGNQQKVVLARWQSSPAKVLLLDEPFQGVDVAARHDLIASIREMKDRAVLIATSDLEEALEVADRVLVMERHSLYDPGVAPHTGTLLAQLQRLEHFVGENAVNASFDLDYTQ